MLDLSSTQLLLVAAGATLILYLLPGARLIGRPLILLATLVHELGHGLTAMLLGGSFMRLQLWWNASGAAHYQGRFSPASRALIAAGGPLGPPLVALGLFWAGGHRDSAHLALAMLATGCVLVALVFVRNLFGFVFVLILGAALALLAWRASDPGAQFACAFLALQMSLSVFSRGDYLFRAEARTSAGVMPSDTAQIAAAIGLPYWFWGGLIALVSVAVVACGLWIFAPIVLW